MRATLEYEDDSDEDQERDFSVLLGKTLTSVEGEAGDDAMVFRCSDGTTYELYHSPDCCETVSIESIVGDLSDLIGEPLLMAEESTGDTPADFDPKLVESDGYVYTRLTESYTWTFYKLATRKGYVDIRWLGESNGYYSEEVNFQERLP